MGPLFRQAGNSELRGSDEWEFCGTQGATLERAFDFLASSRQNLWGRCFIQHTTMYILGKTGSDLCMFCCHMSP